MYFLCKFVINNNLLLVISAYSLVHQDGDIAIFTFRKIIMNRILVNTCSCYLNVSFVLKDADQVSGTRFPKLPEKLWTDQTETKLVNPTKNTEKTLSCLNN